MLQGTTIDFKNKVASAFENIKNYLSTDKVVQNYKYWNNESQLVELSNFYQELQQETKVEKAIEDNKDIIVSNNFNSNKLNHVLFDIILKDYKESMCVQDCEAIFTDSFYQPRKIMNYSFPDLSTHDENIRSTEFLANLRLHNRIEKRQMKNYNEMKKYSKYGCVKDIKWYDKEVIKVSFSHNGLREEIVYYKSSDKNCKLSYLEIYTKLETLLAGDNNLGKFDKLEDDNDVKYNTSVLEYHIFGCEAIKNPAAFIHNHMVLDLIKDKEMTWEDALCKEQLPMVIGGAIMGARKVNSCYKEFMPHPYLYDKDYESLSYHPNYYNDHTKKAKLLLEKEVNITKKWLEWKLGKGISKYVIKNCCEENDKEAIKAIWECILEAAEEWYPGVLGSVEEIN